MQGVNTLWQKRITDVSMVSANVRCSTNVGLMPGQRRTRWPSIKPALGECDCVVVLRGGVRLAGWKWISPIKGAATAGGGLSTPRGNPLPGWSPHHRETSRFNRSLAVLIGLCGNRFHRCHQHGTCGRRIITRKTAGRLVISPGSFSFDHAHASRALIFNKY